jgi:hypothetical protein
MLNLARQFAIGLLSAIAVGTMASSVQADWDCRIACVNACNSSFATTSSSRTPFCEPSVQIVSCERFATLPGGMSTGNVSQSQNIDSAVLRSAGSIIEITPNMPLISREVGLSIQEPVGRILDPPKLAFCSASASSQTNSQ